MCKMDVILVTISQRYIMFIRWTRWGRICTPKRLYFHAAVVFPAAKVFFSPSPKKILLFPKILSFGSNKTAQDFWFVSLRTNQGFCKCLHSLQEPCSLPMCTGDSTLGWKQTRRDTGMFAFSFISSGERTVTLAGMYLSKSLERYCMGSLENTCMLGDGKLNWAIWVPFCSKQ